MIWMYCHMLGSLHLTHNKATYLVLGQPVNLCLDTTHSNLSLSIYVWLMVGGCRSLWFMVAIAILNGVYNLLVVWNMRSIFPHMLGIISILIDELIFFRGAHIPRWFFFASPCTVDSASWWLFQVPTSERLELDTLQKGGNTLQKYKQWYQRKYYTC